MKKYYVALKGGGEQFTKANNPEEAIKKVKEMLPFLEIAGCFEA